MAPVKQSDKRAARKNSFLKEKSLKIPRKVYRCEHCNYWSAMPSLFHPHVLKHRKISAYSCSACDFKGYYALKILRHIRKSIKNGCSLHRDARTVTCKNLPEDRYASYLEMARVPSADIKGWLASRKTKTNEDAALDNSSSKASKGTGNLKTLAAEASKDQIINKDGKSGKILR